MCLFLVESIGKYCPKLEFLRSKLKHSKTPANKAVPAQKTTRQRRKGREDLPFMTETANVSFVFRYQPVRLW
jgi:hypothetical protein